MGRKLLAIAVSYELSAKSYGMSYWLTACRLFCWFPESRFSG